MRAALVVAILAFSALAMNSCHTTHVVEVCIQIDSVTAADSMLVIYRKPCPN